MEILKTDEIVVTKEVIEESEKFVDETDHFKIEISASFKEESESKKVDRSSTPVMIEDISEVIEVADGGVIVENMEEDSDEELELPSIPIEVQNVAKDTTEEEIESVTSIDEVEELEDVDAYFWFSYEFNKVEKNEFFRCHEWCSHSIEERRSYTGNDQYNAVLLQYYCKSEPNLQPFHMIIFNRSKNMCSSFMMNIFRGYQFIQMDM